MPRFLLQSCSIRELRRHCIMTVSFRIPRVMGILDAKGSILKLLCSCLVCSPHLVNWMKRRGKPEIFNISVRHGSESLRIRPVLGSERFVIPSDLSRHRYLVSLYHLEKPVLLLTQHSVHGTMSSYIAFVLWTGFRASARVVFKLQVSRFALYRKINEHIS